VLHLLNCYVCSIITVLFSLLIAKYCLVSLLSDNCCRVSKETSCMSQYCTGAAEGADIFYILIILGIITQAEEPG
jgi:hypothetical protein